MTELAFKDLCSDSATGPQAVFDGLRARGSLKPDVAQDKVVRRLQQLYDDLAAPLPEKPGFLRWLFGKSEPEVQGPRGIYIYGEVGRGKSMLMDLFFSTAPVTAKRRVHFLSFMLEVHAKIHAWRQMTPDERVAKAGKDAGDDPIPPLAQDIAAGARLLCFDEFQVTDVADAMILSRLFTGLMAAGVVIVATSNRVPEDLYLNGLNRQLFLPFIALVRERLDVVMLSGPTDYRMARLAGAKVYHWPISDAATKALSEAFYRLTDNEVGDRAAVGPEEIEVQGRMLHVPVAARGVAVFSFKRLCENPLGAADYLAIAWRYHTVIIVGIPLLGPEKRNEAKRFVTLIDALYENGVKLLCSAAAAPEGLYPAGDGAFEFHRTVSRLNEMQSADYLARGHAVT
ncbi:cell division protein ZapE [Govanella unica]|uniref:Cell division protein ZapE n=1 Tax=Govanella unica TaxID=2975056 RepID=A0A9X3TVF0_9PROT|nr:cell division protein ZapE [Govania unica]MDA5192740.1 cell division protein ZapE [Govania unica]